MATMKQIAQIAGVSRGTVDRVLNNRGAVNPDTAKRVWEIARSLQYTPNRFKRQCPYLTGCTLYVKINAPFQRRVLYVPNRQHHRSGV